jgi:hypothetical protein
MGNEQSQGTAQQPGAATAPGGPKTIAVVVKEVSRSGHNVTCSIQPDNGASAPYVSNDTITLPEREGPFRIRFRLDGLDWDSAEPMATRRGGCPQGKKGNDNEQIFLQPPVKREMTIVNLNAGEPCTIHYRMNFTNDDYCDPIMINRGLT